MFNVIFYDDSKIPQKTNEAYLSSLVNGTKMFYFCENISSFDINLKSLENGEGMFSDCDNIIEIKNDMPSLKNGIYMFDGCDSLYTIKSDLKSLINGEGMFMDCTNLNTFTGELNSLSNGNYMFCGCGNLTSFNSNLQSLEDGYCMFDGCRLDGASVSNIIHFLPHISSNESITIGVGITSDLKEHFAKDCLCDSWQELENEFSDKNWRVYWQFNDGSSYSLREPQIPIYAKLEEVIDVENNRKQNPHYKYTSQDGSKFYNIYWFHETNGSKDEYTLFDSLAHAIESFGLIPVEK